MRGLSGLKAARCLRAGLIGMGLLGAGCGSSGGTHTGFVDDTGRVGSADGGAPADGEDAGPAVEVPGALVEGLSIAEIAVLQGVKIDVMKGGANVTTRSAPVVSKRGALVRVYVTPAASYTARPVTAELHLTQGDTKIAVLKDTKTLSAASTDATLASTFNFDVPGDDLPPGVEYAVALTDPALTTGASEGTDARFPKTGSQSLGTKSSGDQLKVVVVPVKYNADASGRTPAIDAAQLEVYRATMYSLYPAAKIDVSVHAPMAWPSKISASGTGFSQVLNAVLSLRQKDNAPDDVYYFGAFAPSASMNTYCGSGCVLGLSGVADAPDDASVRASVGVGFAGAEAAITMAHELGHAHGRLHSPCGGAADADPSFPYTGGGIGVWGYDLSKKALINPSKGKDLIGYCQPEWVSDYTYKALFDRMAFVNNAQARTFGFETPRSYRFADVGADGAIAWGTPIEMKHEPRGESHTATYLAADGTPIATETAHFYAYDHLPGGFMLIPEGPASAARVSVSGPHVSRIVSAR
jgi:hypothetical protein